MVVFVFINPSNHHGFNLLSEIIRLIVQVQLKLQAEYSPALDWPSQMQGNTIKELSMREYYSRMVLQWRSTSD